MCENSETFLQKSDEFYRKCQKLYAKGLFNFIKSQTDPPELSDKVRKAAQIKICQSPKIFQGMSKKLFPQARNVFDKKNRKFSPRDKKNFR